MTDYLQQMANATGGVYRPVEGVRVCIIIDPSWMGDLQVFQNKTGTILGTSDIPGMHPMFLRVRLDEDFWPVNPVSISYGNLVPLEGQ